MSKKLPPEIIENIFQRAQQGDSFEQIGRRYGLGRSSIRRIYRREYNRRVNGTAPARKQTRCWGGNELWRSLSDVSKYRYEWKGSLRALYRELGMVYGKQSLTNGF